MNSVTAQAAELKLALEQLYKQAEEADAPDKKKPKYSYKPESKKPESKAKKDDEILSGGAARALDYFPNTWGNARAGKATTLAKAMGQEVDPSVSHPISSSLIQYLKGTGKGLAYGGLAGAGLGAAFNAFNPNIGGSLARRMGAGAVGGGFAGAGLGALGGGITGLVKNEADKGYNVGKIRDDYNAARDAGQEMDLNAANPDLSRWGALLPWGGNHRAGSVDALEQLAGRPARSGGIRGAGRVGNLGYGIGNLGLGLAAGMGSPLSTLGSGIGVGLNTLQGSMEGYGAAARNQRLISELEKGASDDLKDYDDLTSNVPSEFKGAHGEMRKFISDNNKKKGKKVNKSAAFAARLGRYNGAMHKRAFLETLKGMGTQALDAYKGLDPTAQAAILGGGAGAAIGGVGNAMFGKRKKGVGILGRLGRGALAGGAIGGLGGAGINEMAIRKGMGNTGVDRGTYLSPSTSAGEGKRLPVDMANDLLGGLGGLRMSSISKPNLQIDPLDSQIQDSIDKGQL